MDSPIIKSTANDKVKKLRKLYKRQDRERTGLFIVDGYVLVKEALECKASVQSIFADAGRFVEYQDVIDEAKSNNIAVHKVSTDVMKSLSQLKSPQGILAVLKQDVKRINVKETHNAKLLIALDRLQDPGNMGTIIRTADAVGADGIILGEGCVDIYNDKVIRSAMGSILHLPVYRSDGVKDDLLNLESQGWSIACGHLNGDNFYEREHLDKVVLIIGNESKGVSKELVDICGHRWKLPMKGRAESLNAAIAAGIILYEIVRNN